MSQPFLTPDGRTFHRLGLLRPGSFELPFPSCPYPLLLWDHGGEWSQAEREALVLSVIETDCRYAVCGGQTCEKWHDEIDLAFIDAVPEDQQEARFLMTTWHTSEPPLEVAWFFVMNTNSEPSEFSDYLLVEIGTGSGELESAVIRVAKDPEGTANELDPS